MAVRKAVSAVKSTKSLCTFRAENYDLHRNLNEALLLHVSPSFRLIYGRTAVAVTTSAVVVAVASGVATVVAASGSQGTVAATILGAAVFTRTAAVFIRTAVLAVLNLATVSLFCFL